MSQEIENLDLNNNQEYIEIDVPKSITLTNKILIPTACSHADVFEILHDLQSNEDQFKCQIAILGIGSTGGDRNKELKLLESGDPQYAHFRIPMHIEVDVFAPPLAAYSHFATIIKTLLNIQHRSSSTTVSLMKSEEIIENKVEIGGKNITQLTYSTDIDDRAALRGGYVGFVESNHHYDMSFNSDSASITPANRIEVPDTVFVKGIPISAANERDIGYVFGCAGEIVQNDHTGGPKIKIYYDYNTGEPRGDCTIAFIDEETAARAIAMYNGKLFPGGTRPMFVNVARYMINALSYPSNRRSGGSCSNGGGRRGFSTAHGAFYRGSSRGGAFGERGSSRARGMGGGNIGYDRVDGVNSRDAGYYRGSSIRGHHHVNSSAYNSGYGKYDGRYTPY